MTRAFTFLVNPSSGGGAAAGAVVPVARVLRDAGASVEVTYSPHPSAMPDLVAEAVGRGDVVVSVGGDGMLASLAGPVSAEGGTLGLVPAGRGNDFARMLGLPTLDADGPEAVARVLLDGTVRRTDLVGWHGGGAASGEQRVVAGSVYAGIDARAAAYVHRMHRVPSRLQYPWGAVRAVATYRPMGLEVVVDGAAHRLTAALVVVANSGWYGKGMHVAPGAVVDDGLLDVVAVEAASRSALLRAFPSIYDGSHVERPEVTVLRGKRVELRADPAGREAGVPVGGDGEPLGELPGLGHAPAVAEVLPASLSVLVG